MKTIINKSDIRELIASRDLKPSIILLVSVILLTVQRSAGSLEFAARTFSPTSSFQSSTYMFASAFCLLGLIPAAIATFIFHDSLKEYGISVGDWKKGLPISILAFVIISITLLYPASQTAEMRAFYPFDKHAGDSFGAFTRYQLARGILFYSAWEFFFRGFMLFGLRRYVGDWLAICIQTIPSCLWHIGMPTGELFSSIAGGILFGILALRTQSLLWPFLLHYLIGVGLDSFIIMTS